LINLGKIYVPFRGPSFLTLWLGDQLLETDHNQDDTPWQPLHTCTQSCTQHSWNTYFPASGCHRLFDIVRNGRNVQKKQSYTELEWRSAEHDSVIETWRRTILFFRRQTSQALWTLRFFALREVLASTSLTSSSAEDME
jgi:hypothetical protein